MREEHDGILHVEYMDQLHVPLIPRGSGCLEFPTQTRNLATLDIHRWIPAICFIDPLGQKGGARMCRREIGFENPFLDRIICAPELHASASVHLNIGSLKSLPLSPTLLYILRVILEFTTWNEDGLVQGRKEHVQPMFGSLFARNIGSSGNFIADQRMVTSGS
ncbi:hypothetical protein ARMGADRAFT_1077296 [Armillaria gallica]|uniref:Uncharacterized protein n=1 Tax=Armillaria gallica TaxID=47427 RepID=A0A2H3DY22_ARMGA|nr:hypothetical protein ARMGADRAFT_1077296 [Armillaria gallica]